MKTVKLLDVDVYNLEFSIHKDNLGQEDLCHIVAIENNRQSQVLRLSNFNEQQPNFQVIIDKNFLKTSHVSKKSELQMRSDSVQSIDSVSYGENNILRKTLWLIDERNMRRIETNNVTHASHVTRKQRFCRMEVGKERVVSLKEKEVETK